MSDKCNVIEAVEDFSQETKAGLLAKIEGLKQALAESRVAQKCRQVGARMDESVHERPYHYIAGAAAIGALIGVVAGMMIARQRD
jgi:ElaB/YqjD/DUF883 family membrane-anchored ribosome-binding protein